MLTRKLRSLVLGLVLLFTTAVLAAACTSDATTPAPTSTTTIVQEAGGTSDGAVLSNETVEKAVTAGEEKLVEPVRAVGGEVGNLVPELQGISGWLNTEPFTLGSLRGKVVLIDVWTYTCVNCIRTFPYLKEWHAKYADKGLVIVGVHSPEFEFEKVRENVEAAIEKYGLKYRVVQDNDLKTWNALNNLYWPSKYLVDKDGVIRYRHFGEGAYDETEQQIRALLEEAGFQLSGIPTNQDPGPASDERAASLIGGQTRELYAGWDRNSGFASYFDGVKYYEAPLGVPVDYVDPRERYRNNSLYLHGIWTKMPESLVHGRQTEDLEDYIALRFNGTSANVVLDFDGGDPFKVVITLDGEPLLETHRGADIRAEPDGTTYLLVDEPRMYNMVQLLEYGGGNLKLSSNSDRFSIFAFTFGSYAGGP